MYSKPANHIWFLYRWYFLVFDNIYDRLHHMKRAIFSFCQFRNIQMFSACHRTFCKCFMFVCHKFDMNCLLFQIGIFIVYFLDNILGSGWWVMVLYLVQLFAVMVVRGKPYGSEQIVSVLFPKKACCSSWIGPLLAFTWNVVRFHMNTASVISSSNLILKIFVTF